MPKVILYSMIIRNVNTKNFRVIYGHVTPNVISKYWEAYASKLEEDEELIIDINQTYEVQ